MTYEIQIKPRALKQLSKIDNKQKNRILLKINDLSNDPYSANTKSLKGKDDRSMRVGDYRVIYDVFNDKLVVLVLVIGHRKEVYKL